MPIDPKTINTVDHRQLQVLAKEYGVKANQKKHKIIKELLQASSGTEHWEPFQQLRLRLARVPGFSDCYPALTEHRVQREAKCQQLWEALKLGTSLCFLFNHLPDVPDIQLDLSEEQMNDGTKPKAATTAFLEALESLRRSGRWSGESFDLSDLYHDEEHGTGMVPSRVIKVAKVLIDLVDLIPYPDANRHIHDLPVELLSVIFTMAAASDLGEYSIVPRNILLTCRHWRNTALRTATLWTKIDIFGRLRSRQRKVTKEAKKIASFVELSKDKELTVVYHQDRQEVLDSQSDLAEYLTGGTQRIRTFALIYEGSYYISRDYVDRQLQALDRMPRLHTLIIRHISGNGGNYERIRSHSLRCLRMHNASFDWPTCGFPNLEKLKLQEKWSWGSRQMNRFFMALSSMPHLKHLSVRVSEDNYPSFDSLPGYTDLRHTTLPALTILELRGPKYFLTGVLHFLGTPQLHHLCLIGISRTDGASPASWAECTQSFPVLKSLAIRFVPSPKRLLAKIQAKTTQDRELRVDILTTRLDYSKSFQTWEGTVCHADGGKWDCQHADCVRLAETAERAEGGPLNAVRIQTRGVDDTESDGYTYY